MTAYYNEIDPGAAAWLRKLISEGHIAPGDVDERSITEVQPDDVKGYTQAHWFAGIGGWSYALRLAGWGDDRPVWTGSCPCQPFSVAGKGEGENDERHLWPEFRRLIEECGPAICFGEQVASPAGRRWLSGVRADLETLGYGVGAADLCAPGVGAPHIRQRLWWVADSGRSERERRSQSSREHGGAFHAANRCGDGGLADSNGDRWRTSRDSRAEGGGVEPEWGGQSRRVAHAEHPESGLGVEGVEGQPGERRHRSAIDGAAGQRLGDSASRGFGANGSPSGRGGHADEPSPVDGVGNAECSERRPNIEHDELSAGRKQETGGLGGAGDVGFWGRTRVIPCRDGKARRIPVEPALFPLADGFPNRVGLLRGSGNAIVPQVAAEFIRAFEETLIENAC